MREIGDGLLEIKAKLSAAEEGVTTMNLRLDDRRVKLVFRVNTPRFDSPNNLRLWSWAIVLRLALLAGHPVVVVGGCRMGKTLLLSKLTPGKVIDKREEAIGSGMQVTLTETEIPPPDVFSLDECQLFDYESIVRFARSMAEKSRAFCLCAQRYDCIQDAVDIYRTNEKAKKIILVVVGGDSNPLPIRRSIPRYLTTRPTI